MSKTVIKNFRVNGSYSYKGKKTSFKKEFRAVSKENAIEKMYLFLGSKHSIKRAQISIAEVVELATKDITDKLIQEFATSQDISIRR